MIDQLTKLSSQFPIVFPDGGTWTEFTCECNICSKDILDENTLGTVELVFGTYIIKATGYSKDCNFTTRYSYRMHPDMGMTGIDKTGNWYRWTPKRVPKSLVTRILNWIGVA
jgi:hypothetical protein